MARILPILGFLLAQKLTPNNVPLLMHLAGFVRPLKPVCVTGSNLRCIEVETSSKGEILNPYLLSLTVVA